MRAPAPSVRRAFTLLEVLVSIALTIALLGAMFSFFWDLLATRERIIEETARRRAADVLIDHLEHDLFTALVGDGVVGAGIVGDDAEITVLSRGVPARLAERDANLGFADLERATYRFDESTRTISARRDVTRSRPSGSETPAAFAPMGGDVHRVRFRYHDGRAWLDEFDSRRADALPRAIEVAVWFDPSPAEALAAGASPDALDALDDQFTPADRLTFDADAGFDDAAFALASDLDVTDEPPPDRLRVIVLADSWIDDAATDEEPTDG